MTLCNPCAAYVASPPAAGMLRASSATLDAVSRQATRANTTDSGSDPPAIAAPAGIEAAIAAPGAMSVMPWKRASRRPMASLRRPADELAIGCAMDDLPIWVIMARLIQGTAQVAIW